MRRTISGCLLVACPVVLAATAAAGGDFDNGWRTADRRPIATPTVITEPGRYIVTSDLLGGNGDRCVITIASNDVDIDLGGFVLDGGEYANGLCASGVHGIQVTNGTLFIDSADDEPTALIFDRVQRFTIRNVTLYSTEDYLLRIIDSHKGLIENSRFLRSTEQVTVNGSEITIRRSYLPKRLWLSADRSAVVDSTAATFPGDPHATGEIRVSGSHNRIVGNAAGGVIVSAGSDANLVSGNVLNLNAGPGIVVGGRRNRILDNTLIEARDFGLFFSDQSADNTYAGNVAFGNAGIDCDAPSSTAEFCDEGTGNLSAGGNYLPDPR